MQDLPIDHQDLIALHQPAIFSCLTRGQDGLDEDTHDALGRVPTPNDAEAQTLAAVAFLEDDRVEGRGRGHVLVFVLSGQRAKVAAAGVVAGVASVSNFNDGRSIF